MYIQLSLYDLSDAPYARNRYCSENSGFHTSLRQLQRCTEQGGNVKSSRAIDAEYHYDKSAFLHGPPSRGCFLVNLDKSFISQVQTCPHFRPRGIIGLMTFKGIWHLRKMGNYIRCHYSVFKAKFVEKAWNPLLWLDRCHIVLVFCVPIVATA